MCKFKVYTNAIGSNSDNLFKENTIGEPDPKYYALVQAGEIPDGEFEDETIEKADYQRLVKFINDGVILSTIVELYDAKDSRFYFYGADGFKPVSFDNTLTRTEKSEYNLVSLKEINPCYDYKHRVTQSDVDKANEYIEAIHKSRSDKHIQVGDIVELTTNHGDYYKNAHIDRYDEETDTWSVCEQPYIPFISLNEHGGISCSTSGGPWSGIPNNLLLIGKRLKTFKDFGHCGWCAGGAFEFQAEVNVWEYKQPNPLYGDYSTKKWRKYYVTYCVDANGNPKDGSLYRYKSDGIAFKDKQDYEAWIKTFRGVEFKGNWPNQTVVFCYKQRDYLINKDDWDKLDLPMDTRLCNGINLCKVSYDDNAHTVDAYRFSNSGTLDWKRYKEYELARGRDLRMEGFQ